MIRFPMLVLVGPSIHSQAVRTRLIQSLRDEHIDVQGLHDQTWYFLDTKRTLDQNELNRLKSLLNSGQERLSMSGEYIQVIPRRGTQSSWSSKATDILQIAGFSMINRIERGRLYLLEGVSLNDKKKQIAEGILHDRMTEQCYSPDKLPNDLLNHSAPRALGRIASDSDIEQGLSEMSQQLGLSLSAEEIRYLADYYQRAKRTPSDAEIMMFAQVNSEHCRHKIFNAAWTIDGKRQSESLFAMIKHTYRKSPQGVLVAYDDNSAVIEGTQGLRWQRNPKTDEYEYIEEALPILMKVETHNHPTAISPFAGAATGSGGEIRDEAATGRGGRPKAGLCGFTVSNLFIPGFTQEWEDAPVTPSWIASPLQIMLEAPVGAAAFNNEFGRPCLNGYFRTFERWHPQSQYHYGYHKPIMIAGGCGNLRAQHLKKNKLTEGALIIVLGGPAMLIGLGGGAVSSQKGGRDAELDFASVQRENAEMQRRCQEVIDRCASLADANPILSIHDVGAGGLSNAIPELLSDSGVGGRIDLRRIPSADSGMSPLEIWCNEAQERYVLGLDRSKRADFLAICERERCPVAEVGEVTAQPTLEVNDEYFKETSISLPLSVLFENTPQTYKSARRNSRDSGIVITEPKNVIEPKNVADDVSAVVKVAVKRVLSLPAVAAKNFLITIGDRTVGGYTVQDQLVGPWQMPVSDNAVCSADYAGYAGEAMAMGERTPLGLINAEASARIAITEAITNILAADIQSLSDIRLSANWMAACGLEKEDEALFQAVFAVGKDLCPALGIAIPVGKDSLSMQMSWQENGQSHSVISPLSLIVSAFAPVSDVRKCLTPQLKTDEESVMLLLDLSPGKNRLGGSALAQVFDWLTEDCADLDNPDNLINFFHFIKELRSETKVISYHDRSDGGLFVTLCEMAFAGHCGLDVCLDGLGDDFIAVLFCEEPGVVIQVKQADLEAVQACAKKHQLDQCCHTIGTPQLGHQFKIQHNDRSEVLDLMELKERWWQTSYQMQLRRDNPDCAKEELKQISDESSQGLYAKPSFSVNELNVPRVATQANLKVAILREQGVNGHMEMAAAFQRAGFVCVDVHMTDLLAGAKTLTEFNVLAVCGGFSYGDVLGAGRGWAVSILFNNKLRDEFEHFFRREDTLTLGVCNGCQTLAQLTELIPGTVGWPKFIRNRSDQFESRLSMVEVVPSASRWLADMAGSHLPLVVAHGEGKAVFSDTALAKKSLCLRYIDYQGEPTENYPCNPNGSTAGMTGFGSTDGRVLIMMPHPERMFRSIHYPCLNAEWGEAGPWLKLFCNARSALE